MTNQPVKLFMTLVTRYNCNNGKTSILFIVWKILSIIGITFLGFYLFATGQFYNPYSLNNGAQYGKQTLSVVVFPTSSDCAKTNKFIHSNYSNIISSYPSFPINIYYSSSVCLETLNNILMENRKKVNIRLHRLNLKDLSYKTPVESFIINHAYNRLKRGKEFENDIIKISVLLVLYKNLK